MKILLCEDNPADLEKAREQIEAAAETYPEESMLEICQTAEACRAYLKSEVPDLVFMDIFMAETSVVD